MKNKKTSNVSKASIVFYVMAVLFLFASLFFAYQTYQSIVEYKKSAEPALSTVIGAYISNCGAYVAYAFLLYGVGVILNKFTATNSILIDCMAEVINEPQEEDSLDEFLSDMPEKNTEDQMETEQKETEQKKDTE